MRFMLMSITKLLVAPLLGLAILSFSSSAQAGSFTVAGCSSTGWASSQVANPLLRTSSIKNFVSHNSVSATSLGSSVTTISRGQAGTGFLQFWNGGSTGPYDIDGDNTNIHTSPNVSYHLLNGGDCSYIANGVYGKFARTGNVDSNGANVYGVGNGSYTSLRFNVDTSASNSSKQITAVGADLRTYSAAEGCIAFSCSESGVRLAANSYNRADLQWQSGFFINDGQVQGFKGDNSADGCTNGCSSRTEPSGEPLPQTPMVFWGPSSFKVQTGCNSPGGCVSNSTQDRSRPTGAYLRAFSALRPSGGDITITIADNDGGSASAAAPSGWSKGTISVGATGADSGSGVSKVGVALDAARSGAQTTNSPSVTNRSRRSCSDGRRDCAHAASYSVDTTSLSNGTHSVYARSWDDAGNAMVESSAVAFNVDNQNPGLGSCGSLSASAPTSSKDSSNKGWVRSEVTVQGSGCDTVSGLSGSKIEYQQAAPSEISINSINWPSSASNLASSSCSLDSPVAANLMSNISSCKVDTSAFADGTALRFRWSGTDLAGNVASSSWTDPVYTDNTAPAAADVGWQAWDGSAWQSIETGWTNATKTRLTWNSVSQGNGSPLDKYSYLYDSDVDGEAADGCVLQQPSSTWLAIPSANVSEALSEDRSEQCRQGKHQAWLWIKDIAGNGAGGSPMSSYKSSAASNPTLNYDSVPTPQSRDESWAASDTLAPVGFSVVPSSGGLAGSWTGINSFTGTWTNPTITSIVTQAPILKALYKVGGGSTSGPLASQDIQSYSGCLLSGAACSLESIKAPSEGSHPVKLWLMDAAGNASLEQSAAGTINWRDGTCVPIN